jgi:hypothetical protein
MSPATPLNASIKQIFVMIRQKDADWILISCTLSLCTFECCCCYEESLQQPTVASPRGSKKKRGASHLHLNCWCVLQASTTVDIMRPLTDEETATLFEKLANYIGKDIEKVIFLFFATIALLNSCCSGLMKRPPIDVHGFVVLCSFASCCDA